MKPVVSPKEIALAIGVSESSVKRWVDEGMIRAEKTTGGHRRIAISELIRYTRDTQTRIIRPELLGLPEEAATVATVLTDADATEQFQSLLLEGDAPRARGLVLSLYLRGRSVAEICDLPLHGAMKQIGALYQHEPAGIFYEHRATEICVQALNRLRSIIEPGVGAPIAIGGAFSGDTHGLSSLAAATVLCGEGVEAINLGADTPIDALIQAVTTHRPLFAWVSLSWAADYKTLPASIHKLADALRPHHVPLVVGGHALASVNLASAPGLHFFKSMIELAEFTRSVIDGSAS